MYVILGALTATCGRRRSGGGFVQGRLMAAHGLLIGFECQGQRWPRAIEPFTRLPLPSVLYTLGASNRRSNRAISSTD